MVFVPVPVFWKVMAPLAVRAPKVFVPLKTRAELPLFVIAPVPEMLPLKVNGPVPPPLEGGVRVEDRGLATL